MVLGPVLKFLSLDKIPVDARFEVRVVEYTFNKKKYTKTIPYYQITYPNGEVREMHQDQFTRNYQEVK